MRATAASPAQAQMHHFPLNIDQLQIAAISLQHPAEVFQFGTDFVVQFIHGHIPFAL